MGDVTQIEWAGSSWNPWYGCTKISPGCDHCYMFRDMRKYGRDPETVTRSKTKFREPLKWKAPRRVFTCSWSDWFHEAADEWRPEAWEIIRATPHLTYLILTKRPGRIAAHLPWTTEPWPNVWLGVTVELDRFAWRAKVLSEIPAAVRFISAEPLLGPLPHLKFHRECGECRGKGSYTAPECEDGCDHLPEACYSCNGSGYRERAIDWLITGGESGPGHRPIDPQWVRDLRDRCLMSGVAYFHKQWGGINPKSGGRLLDGREWSQFPDAVTATVEPEPTDAYLRRIGAPSLPGMEG